MFVYISVLVWGVLPLDDAKADVGFNLWCFVCCAVVGGVCFICVLCMYVVVVCMYVLLCVVVYGSVMCSVCLPAQCGVSEEWVLCVWLCAVQRWCTAMCSEWVSKRVLDSGVCVWSWYDKLVGRHMGRVITTQHSTVNGTTDNSIDPYSLAVCLRPQYWACVFVCQGWVRLRHLSWPTLLVSMGGGPNCHNMLCCLLLFSFIHGVMHTAWEHCTLARECVRGGGSGWAKWEYAQPIF